jgi:MaoC dehydratase-like protein
MEQKFNTDLITGFGPDKMLPDLAFAEMESGWDCGGGTYKITKEEVEKFAKLMGDPNTGDVNVPVGMIYIFGLRICWDRKVFIDQAIRAGDKITFSKPARVGDTITTKLSIADKKEVKKEKDGKVRINKFLYVDMNATNQNGEKITDIQMSFLLPRTMK